MSRSEYVWVVTGPNRCLPLAAFTVKSELNIWLSEREGIMCIARFRHTDMMYRDAPPVWLDPRTLEPLPEQKGETV